MYNPTADSENSSLPSFPNRWYLDCMQLEERNFCSQSPFTSLQLKAESGFFNSVEMYKP